MVDITLDISNMLCMCVYTYTYIMVRIYIYIYIHTHNMHIYTHEILRRFVYLIMCSILEMGPLVLGGGRLGRAVSPRALHCTGCSSPTLRVPVEGFGAWGFRG